jgi:hypothetical protein
MSFSGAISITVFPPQLRRAAVIIHVTIFIESPRWFSTAKKVRAGHSPRKQFLRPEMKEIMDDIVRLP